jgi:molecular chaperone GrpE
MSDAIDKTEGREALEEDASEGSLAPSPELEDALREAADAVEARETSRRGATRGGEAAALREELERLRDVHLRLQADFENFRRRALKEREEAFRYGHENLVKDLLGTVDNLDRAIEHASRSEGGDFQGMLQGVELVRRELLGALAKHGVEEVPAEGEAFDPTVHEAMAQHEDATVPANTVVEVFQKGYRLRDHLLRPAKVVVAKGGPERGAEKEKGAAPE